MIFHRGGDLLASQSCYAALVDRWSIRPTRPPLTYGIFAHTSTHLSSIPTIQDRSVVPSRGPRTFPVRIVTHFAHSAPIGRWSHSAHSTIDGMVSSHFGITRLVSTYACHINCMYYTKLRHPLRIVALDSFADVTSSGHRSAMDPFDP